MFCTVPGVAYAQGSDCPTIVRNALEVAGTTCDDTGRNQACYGNITLEAVPQPDIEDFVFEEVGDRIDVAGLRALHLSGLDDGTGEWGVAVMRIQANMPETMPGQNVTFVLFGDVEIENVGEELPALPATANANANLRAGPSTGEAIVGALVAGESVTLDGRVADNAWLRLHLPESTSPAWVFASLVMLDDDVGVLDVVDPTENAPTYGPMQAFYFRSGVGDAPCAEAPDSGVLIQTPRGAGEVAFNLNGLGIILGSTVYVQGDGRDDYLTIAQLDGMTTFPQMGLHLYPGQFQQFMTEADGNLAVGEAGAFNADDLVTLPIGLLTDRVDIPQRESINSGGQGIVANYYRPSSGATPIGAVILLHGRDLDKSSWDWLIGRVRDAGWFVITLDMPGHGETGGPDPDWLGWGQIVLDTISYLRNQHDIQSGVIMGSSIGANVAVNVCADLPDWCRGVSLLSPGTNYFGVRTLEAMERMGERRVQIITTERDSRGGPGSVARQIAGAGQNVTTSIYDGDAHGTDMAGEYDVAGDVMRFLAGFASDS